MPHHEPDPVVIGPRWTIAKYDPKYAIEGVDKTKAIINKLRTQVDPNVRARSRSADDSENITES
jgi:hypothetical protein